MCACVCVCVCVRARVCVCVCVGPEPHLTGQKRTIDCGDVSLGAGVRRKRASGPHQRPLSQNPARRGGGWDGEGSGTGRGLGREGGEDRVTREGHGGPSQGEAADSCYIPLGARGQSRNVHSWTSPL